MYLQNELFIQEIMATTICLAAVSLNLTALDFDRNYKLIHESIVRAKEAGASYRFGPELEVTGYCCADSFLEPDTDWHSLQILAKLMNDDQCRDIVVDIGMPIVHRGVRHNARVIFYNKRLILIRPKIALANYGNYREMRHFTSWKTNNQLETFYLPPILQQIDDQKTCMFGSGLIKTNDTCIGFDICEELWVGSSIGIQQGMGGAEIILNSSGSHFQIGKSFSREMLVNSTTFKVGGIYGLTNVQGCDGDRIYFDGETLFSLNGKVTARNEMHSLQDCQILYGGFDLNEVRGYRAQLCSTNVQASSIANVIPCVYVDINLCRPIKQPLTQNYVPNYNLTPSMEISLVPAMWLWDYLRKSNIPGVFIPLSGGIDSASTACIVIFMCKRIYDAVESGNNLVLNDLRRVTRDENFTPTSWKCISNRLLVTCYMSSDNSSKSSQKRASELAKEMNSQHQTFLITPVVNAMISVFTTFTKRILNYRIKGGSRQEDIALQNIQSRCRMILAYMFAQLHRLHNGEDASLLVLGCSNTDECLRGYTTKYDNSSADLNLIGSLTKNRVRDFVSYAREQLNFPILDEILNAVPSAELVPNTQEDVIDMGFTYDELGRMSLLRKNNLSGPVSMFISLWREWDKKMTAVEIANKVKQFFIHYALNRHKMTVATPSVFLDKTCPDDHRFDMRQFLYNTKWTWQFNEIDKLLERLNKPNPETI